MTSAVACAQIAAAYDALLASFVVGDDGLAERRGWMLTFVPTEEEALVFQVWAAG